MIQREILFKAKRTDNGEWMEGTPIYPEYEIDKCYMITRVHGMDERFGHGNRGNVLLIYDAYEVDPETVCQYTGLTDKNGKKIFEGDKFVVCLCPETKNGIVKYNTDSSSFWMDFSDCFSTFLDFEIAKRKVGEKVWIQITGNIHDN